MTIQYRQNILKTKASLLVISIAVISMAPMSASAQDDMKLDDLPIQPVQTVVPESEAPTLRMPGSKSATAKPTAPLAAPTAEPEEPDVLVELDDDLFADEKINQPATVPYSGTYYDSSSVGPGRLGASAGPRQVDPRYEPGSSFVVVHKNAPANSQQAKIVAAQRALKLGRNSAALELYEGLYKKNRKNPQILMGLAVAQQQNGFNESAVATYEELIKVDPRNSNAISNMMGLLEQRQPRTAYNKLMKMWNSGAENPVVAAQLGLVSAKMGNLEEASRYLGVASSMEPQNPLHFYNLAIVLDKANSSTSAIEYYQKALEIDVSNSATSLLPRDQIYDRLAALRRL